MRKLFYASRDAIIPVRHAEYFHRDIPKSKMIIYEGAGHVLHEVKAKEAASDILHFLDQTLCSASRIHRNCKDIIHKTLT